jgi:hypothetical protein
MSEFARRDRVLVPIANFILRRCSQHYQAMTKGAIVYGLEAAARDSADLALGHEPIAQLIRDALRKRGWRVVVPVAESHGAPPFECPNGHRFPNLWTAVEHQIDRELRMLAQEITREAGFEEDDGREQLCGHPGDGRAAGQPDSSRKPLA